MKIPRTVTSVKTTKANVKHGLDEVAIWNRMRKSKVKYKALQKYLPEIVFWEVESGIVGIRMYQKVKRCREMNLLLKELEAMVTKVMGTKDADMHYNNIGVDRQGNIKITDLGLFIAGKC